MLIINSLILLYIIAYGIPFGFMNNVYRVLSIFGEFKQNTLGGILDGIWVACILYMHFIVGWVSMYDSLIAAQL